MDEIVGVVDSNKKVLPGRGSNRVIENMIVVVVVSVRLIVPLGISDGLDKVLNEVVTRDMVVTLLRLYRVEAGVGETIVGRVWPVLFE